MEQETIIQRNPRVVFRQITDGTGVLLHLDSTNYHGLDPTGALIWNLLDSPKSIDMLLAELRASFPETPPALADDINEFVRDLKDRDLIQAGTRPTS